MIRCLLRDATEDVYRLSVAPASYDRCAPLHADVEHTTRTPVDRALVTPHATTVATAAVSVIGPAIAVPAVAIVPVSADVNTTWADLKSLRLGCSYLACT